MTRGGTTKGKYTDVSGIAVSMRSVNGYKLVASFSFPAFSRIAADHSSHVARVTKYRHIRSRPVDPTFQSCASWVWRTVQLVQELEDSQFPASRVLRGVLVAIPANIRRREKLAAGTRTQNSPVIEWFLYSTAGTTGTPKMSEGEDLASKR